MIYIALILDKESHTLLTNMTEMILKENGLQEGSRIYCHHMTVAFNTMFDDEIIGYLEENKGKGYSIKATHLGMSERAIAVKVETDCPSYNRIKHITLATINGGKPKESNQITKWIELPESINLKGYLEGVE